MLKLDAVNIKGVMTIDFEVLTAISVILTTTALLYVALLVFLK